MTTTPLHIGMLLHYHAIAEPYAIRQPEHRHSMAVRLYRQDLYRRGLIQPTTLNGAYVVLDEARAKLFAENDREVADDHGFYGTTVRGREMVERLCNVGDKT